MSNKVIAVINGFDYNIFWNHYDGEIKTPTRTWKISLNDDNTVFYLYISEGEGSINETSVDIIDGCLLNGRLNYKTDRNKILAKCLTFINEYEQKAYQS